jgi:Fic family protein
MKWNWQQVDWPEFTYDKAQLEPLEAQFLKSEGILLGAFKHLSQDDKDTIKIDIISNEAIKTSEIEGEFLNRESVQSSIRRQFGLQTDNRKSSPPEQGIAEMMVDLYQTFQEPLTHEKLFAWHRMITNGRTDLVDIGRYRTHPEPMQVVSGYHGKTNVHFEAPPSAGLDTEMSAFMEWFNRTSPNGSAPLPALTRCGIAHLYFVCIHPFEDGNGRVGRGIAEKSLAQTFGEPTLIALSNTIFKHRKDYYNALEQANKRNEITQWLLYFSNTILDAQRYTETYIEFLIDKTKLYDHLRGKLNERQEKVLARMFKEGPEGFLGGLSADNYLTITKTSRATATRDLQELVELGALKKTGERRHTRYYLSSGL